ncbi:LPD29 domain-containing protein [Vibrio vulnificus]|uniref:LPD29 domain-containing protein n=1 Tax=Vibrio vulnificus TaxID=672 RepID=UPI0028628F6B|nr:hypothetical protein [Vibrio vulnificus]ELC9582578.1 hypothetical protein [Vibrio vulnificus]
MMTRNFTGFLSRGMAVYCKLYNKGLGYIVSVDDQCNKNDCQSIGGVAASGGGNVMIVYVDGSMSDYPECLLRTGVQIAIYEGAKPANEEYLSQLISNAELRKRQTEEAEKKAAAQFAADVSAIEADPQYKHLMPVREAKGSECAHVAKNIRRALKKANIKVDCVRSERSSVYVYWTNGPTEAEMKTLIGVFKEGYYNAYEDYHGSSSTPFTTVFGGVDYLHYRRDVNEALEEPVSAHSQSVESSDEVISERNDNFAYSVGEHTKTHKPLYIVSFLTRVERETYLTAKSLAESFKGYYSRYVNGFIFPDEESAKTFMATSN